MSHRKISISILTVVATVLSSCTSTPTHTASNPAPMSTTDMKPETTTGTNWRSPAGLEANDSRRGSPAMFDPGPAKDSGWAELFGQAPNYRGLGIEVKKIQAERNELKPEENNSDEKFRWMMGPMWYRGRLGTNQVKVFVVGQEGAQDENVTNRAFTGSTGTKTQNFINHLGVYSSYVFMNTYVYTINGQRATTSPTYLWMEQDLDSPIVKYRHKLFNHMAETNKDSLAVILGVGGGGQSSVVTWINANGGKCSVYNEIANCDTSGVEKKFGMKKKLLVLGVPHPGGANPNNGGAEALKNIIRGFSAAAAKAAVRIKKDAAWLPVDTWIDAAGVKQTMKRGNLDAEYKYQNAPIPYMDFAFGTNWRMGAAGTSSNRRGAAHIQIFSQIGQYNPPQDLFTYQPEYMPDLVIDKNDPIPEMGALDLPYESAKFDPKNPKSILDFDYGPCGEAVNVCPLSLALQGQGKNKWPDFAKLGVTSHWSFGNGPIYRGRAKGAKLVFLVDQTSHDDMFSTRALTGTAGQKLQAFINATGVGKDYLVIRTLPVDTLDLTTTERLQVVKDAQVTKVRNEILTAVLTQGDVKAIITMGPTAKYALKDFPTKVPYFDLHSPDQGYDYGSDWSKTLQTLGSIAGLPVKEFDDILVNIPRYDLPVHTRWWMGTAGDRGSRPVNNQTGRPDPNHYRISAPSWVSKLKPMRFTEELKIGNNNIETVDDAPDSDN